MPKIRCSCCIRVVPRAVPRVSYIRPLATCCGRRLRSSIPSTTARTTFGSARLTLVGSPATATLHTARSTTPALGRTEWSRATALSLLPLLLPQHNELMTPTPLSHTHPHSACCHSVMFEGIPTYPDPGRFWAIVEKYKVNSFYTGGVIRCMLVL